MEYGMILLRVVAGLALAAHGSQKLFGSFGGSGPAGTLRFFAGLGFRRATCDGVHRWSQGYVIATTIPASAETHPMTSPITRSNPSYPPSWFMSIS
jgi:uncharacterized membrane protein YphA (DoxX/SURF4 family)